MPLETFFNLPEEKRKRIVESASFEFSASGYTGASIQRIAEKAGISKGSMYQYFRNKRELFLYVLDISIETGTKEIRDTVANINGLGYFDLLEILLINGLKYARKHPWIYLIYRRSEYELQMDMQREINSSITSPGQLYHEELLKGALNKREISSNISMEMAGFIVYILIREFSEYILEYLKPVDEKDPESLVHQFVQILKNGIKGGE